MNKSICVFCGARMGNNPGFGQAALDLGYVIAKNEWRLVYGAGDVGLMGAVAEGAQVSGATTFGVIPKHLLKHEVGKRDLDQFIVTDDMHSRKKLMFMNSDAVVLLPGGAGSMEEFFEVTLMSNFFGFVYILFIFLRFVIIGPDFVWGQYVQVHSLKLH